MSEDRNPDAPGRTGASSGHRSPSAPSEEASGSDLLRERREKLERLREAGIEPFPHTFPDREEIGEVRRAHEGLPAGEESESRHRVAGRFVARRGHGGAAFLDLRDSTGEIQLHAREDLLGETSFSQLVGLDLGDVIGIEGVAFATKRGELSLRVEGWDLLAKSLRPPPDRYHGLEDTETRYRRRELDLIANEETRRLFATRAAVVREVRRYFDDHGFVEAETPVLQPLYGGALARPFVTHHNALDRDFYLRIATELYLKRLIVGGFDRVYELGKDFRNEGISHKHRARTSATRGSRTSTTPSSRCSSVRGLRRLQRHRRASRAPHRHRLPAGHRGDAGAARRRGDRLRRALEVDHPA